MKFTKVRAALSILIALIVVWLVYRQFFAIIDDFNYRLTANFEENGRTVTGSGVVRVISRPQIICIIDVPCVEYSHRGEAFPVRFSNNRIVFVMLAVAEAKANSGRWPISAIYDKKPSVRKMSELPHTPLLVPAEYTPTILYFSDLSDPTSAQIVDPQNAFATAGAGIRLTSMTIQITDDPVKWELEEILPWVRNIKTANPKDKQYVRGIPRLYREFPQYLYINQW
jgi:hypothetical protein